MEKVFATSIDKSAGALSVVWAVGGFSMLVWGGGAPPEFSRALPTLEVLAFLMWFGISLLLVIAGIRRGNKFGRTCSLVTISIVLVLFAEPFLGVARGVGNLFRKDEYAHEMPGAPRYWISAAIDTREQTDVFTETVSNFAERHGFRECRQKRYDNYSGPLRPTHKGEHVAVLSQVLPLKHGERLGSVRVWAYQEAYSADDLQRKVDALTEMLNAALPGRVEVRTER
jgi:hypothetical protein